MEFETDKSDEWYAELFKILKNEGIRIKIIFGAWRLPTKNLVDAISDYFEAIIVVSPETADMKIRMNLKGKKLAYSNKEFVECLNYIFTKSNLYIQVYFGYFLPGETCKSVHQTMLFIMDILHRYPKIEIEYSAYTADPGSILHSNSKKADVTIMANSITDYLNHYKQIYITEKEMEKPQDLRLFSPNSMSKSDILMLETEIKIFQLILDRYKTTCYYFSLMYGDRAFIDVVEKLSKNYSFDKIELIYSDFMKLIQATEDELLLSEALNETKDVQHYKMNKKGVPPIYKE